MMLSEAASLLRAEFRGEDRAFAGAAIDSRQLEAGQLFVAFVGEQVDGHDFVTAAAERNAAGALVQSFVDCPLPQIRVENCRDALGALAAAWRRRFHGLVVGLTGSNGKTTVKELVSALLGQKGKVLATRGNLNNEIGMPLTLMGLRAGHDWAVIEMGANHPGEIALLTSIASPDLVLITNAGPAHLEGFGTVEGVARAKGEIVTSSSDHAVCVLNADDRYFPLWREMAGGRRVVSFGFSEQADVRASFSDSVRGYGFDLHIDGQQMAVNFSLLGRHNIQNALAATAVARIAGLDMEQIRAGLEGVQPVPGRLCSRDGENGSLVIDDTYNANPGSMAAALKVLAEFAGRQRILVLGDMAELGGDALALHADLGRQARELGIERLLAVGPLSEAAVMEFGEGGNHFADQEELVAMLRELLSPEVVVLVKGSRSARMEAVVNNISG